MASATLFTAPRQDDSATVVIIKFAESPNIRSNYLVRVISHRTVNNRIVGEYVEFADAVARAALEMKSTYFSKEHKMNQPKLNEGELYLGIFTDPATRAFQHVILLPDELESFNWNDAMAWAAKRNGDLPNRSELAFLHMTMPSIVRRDWYWSRTQHAANSNYAWCQVFDNGHQSSGIKSAELRARAVRRFNHSVI